MDDLIFDDYSEPRKESDDEAIARLAAMSPLQYDRVRKNEAEALGIQLSTLDEMVKSARKNKRETNDSWFDEIHPWPESVNPAMLFNEITETILRFIICDQHVANTASLWVTMTYLMDDIYTAPIAMITAPEKGSGKTQFLSVLQRLVHRGLPVSGITAAALFRVMEAQKPTMLIDETDAFLADNEELRMVLNAGHTRDSAYVVRCTGEDHEPTRFCVWGAKALSGINNKGKLNPTLVDRSIVLELRKKLPTEHIQKLNRASDQIFHPLRRKLARFALDYSHQIRDSSPSMPQELDGRQEDNWEPLFAIADTAGMDWSEKARRAERIISSSEVRTAVGTELLADIRGAFDGGHANHIYTAELIKMLCADDEKPWATYNRGQSITPKQIGNLLTPYGIQSKQIRSGVDNKKGYCRENFEDAFARYLSYRIIKI